MTDSTIHASQKDQIEEIRSILAGAKEGLAVFRSEQDKLLSDYRERLTLIRIAKISKDLHAA